MSQPTYLHLELFVKQDKLDEIKKNIIDEYDGQWAECSVALDDAFSIVIDLQGVNYNALPYENILKDLIPFLTEDESNFLPFFVENDGTKYHHRFRNGQLEEGQDCILWNDCLLTDTEGKKIDIK